MSSDHDIHSWRNFLYLGEEILQLTNVEAQAEAICRHIQKDNIYQGDIWLSENISRIPGLHNLSMFSSTPQSLLMQRALETRKICNIGKSGNPKIYAHSETVYTIAYPLVVQNSVLGVIQVIRTDSRPMTEDEIEYFEGLSANAANALHINHQTIIKNWRYEQLSLVRSVSSKIANSQSLSDLPQQVTKLILDAFHYYAVTVFTIEPSTNQLIFQACSSPVLDDSGDKLDFGANLYQGLAAAAAKEGVEILANDVSHDPRYKFVKQLPLTKAEAVFPLKVEDRILGVLDIQSEHIYAFHEMDMNVLRSLADNIALALEGVRLYDGLQRRVEELATVAEVGRALSSILDSSNLLQQVVEIIYEKFHYPFVHLFLIQGDQNNIVYQAGAGERSKELNNSGLVYSINDKNGIIPWVARNGKTLIANDVDHEKKYRPSKINPSGTSSEMAVALIFASEVLGVLDIQSDHINSFDDEDKFLFEALADSIAIAIRNAKLFSSEKWRRQASDSLREVAGLLSSNMELNNLLDVILAEIEKILPCSASAIWLVNDTNFNDFDQANSLNLAAVHGNNAETVRETYNNNPESAIWLTKVLKSTEPMIRTENDQMDPLGWSKGYINEYSAIAAPLKVGNQSQGVLVLVNKSTGRYGIESMLLTSTFAAYAAVAIQNARLYASAQEQAWVSTVLLQVAEATRSLTSIEELLNAVVRLTPMLVGIKGCSVFLWESSIGKFTLSGTHGMHCKQTDDNSVYVVRPGESPALEQILESKNPIFIDDLGKSIPFLIMDGGSNKDIKIVLLPLISRGSILGACLVAYAKPDNSNQLDPVENERLAIIQGIAHQTAIAVENIKLLETQQQETYISAALLQVAQTVVTHNEMKDLYASIVQITPILVGSEICLIYLWDEIRKMHVLVESNGIKKQILEESNQTEFLPGQFPLLDLIRKQDQLSVLPICVTNPDDPLCWAEIDLPEGAVSFDFELNNDPLLVGMPLSVKGEVYGILLVKDPGTEKMYLTKRLEILTGIAQQTALAIQNDRLENLADIQERLEREFQIAREIQKTFLPSEMPIYKEWELDVRWRPAREVGGDFYDVFELSDNRLAMLVADVTDKGMSAALYMTVTRTLLRTVAQQFNTPAEILTNVNKLLLRDTPHGMFITAFLGILDLRSSELTYANAGHNLPICKHPFGPLEKLQKGSMPLGIMEKLSLKNNLLKIEPGDSLILFTDGVTEAYTATDFFGDQRLEDAIRQARNQEPATILDSIDHALVEFQESEIPSDDVTLLVVHHHE
jgi:sigma-B regulation protein RsbU (phosphoserine phosphatase)